ncbi:hypothetical protein BGZ95_002690 [Linnemannia exigua]|uniref:Uncharacterized protein n=1 Tax=Linnemannia exigua TaxID=604196 RepID=A0AAD4D562_9FUNG|nr:hypothetical protein BGZ95_002690 [Linnemannia exigua]
MKVTVLLSLLPTLSVVTTGYTVPIASPVLGLRTYLSRPSTSQEGVVSPPTNGSARLASASLVRYDHVAADALIAKYNNISNGSRSSFPSNAIDGVALFNNARPFCVALSLEWPSRVRIFKDKPICDEDGWRTLFIFTAHTQKDVHHAPYPVCIATSTNTNPAGSMLFVGQESCTESEWTTDFVFYMSGKINADPMASLTHESTAFWRASEPERMMFYPYYEGTTFGWKNPAHIMYRSRWRLATGKEMTLLEGVINNHLDIRTRIEMADTPGAITHRCVQNLIQVFDLNVIHAKSPRSLIGMDNADFVQNANRDECSSLVQSSEILLGQVSKDGITSVQVIIDNKVYAAVSLRENTKTPDHYVRLALQESLRTGKPLPLAVDPDSPDNIVAIVGGVLATFGGKTAFTESIPNA